MAVSHRRLIVCLDGTGNDGTVDQHASNVYRICQCITAYDHANNVHQHKAYFKGIFTEPDTDIAEGALGGGAVAYGLHTTWSVAKFSAKVFSIRHLMLTNGFAEPLNTPMMRSMS